MDTYDNSVHIQAQESMAEREAMAQASADATEGAAMQMAGEGSACPDIYVVQPGDTYYGIAGKLGITVYELSTLNPYVDPDTLEIGQYLCIPLQTEDGVPTAAVAREPAGAPGAIPYALERPRAAPEGSNVALPPVTPGIPFALSPAIERPPMALPVPPTATLPEVQACPANHTRVTAQSGGDVSTVLRRYNVSYQALKTANPHMNVDALHAGQTLCVPPAGARGLCEDGDMFTHIVERSDTLDSIARRYRVSAASLLRANPNFAPTDFTAGRVVCVPKYC